MKKFEVCDRVSITALSLSVILGIIAFFPGGFLSETVLKGYVVIVCTLVAFVAWLLGRLLEGSFKIPWTPVLASALALVIVLFLSALFSHAGYLTFLGQGFEQGTFAVFGSMLLGLFLASMLFTTRRRIAMFLQVFFVTYFILALYQLAHVFFPAATTLHTFTNTTDTPAGLWSDFGFLSGAALVGFTLMIQFMKPRGLMRVIAVIGALLGLFFVILTNILVVWILVGLSAMLILIYVLIVSRNSETRHFSFLAFSLSLVALLFILANSLIGGTLATVLKAQFINVYPNLSATLHVSEMSLHAHPVLGIGPNRFAGEWLTKRPLSVNGNTLWDVPFGSGSSLLLTIAVLSGIAGILAILFFVGSFFYESLRKVFRSSTNAGSEYVIFSLFVLSLYFLLSVILFSPGIVVTVCTCAFIGIFLGGLTEEKLIPEKTLNFLKDQRSSFFSIFCIVALLMFSAGMAYGVTERFGAIVFYQKALVNIQANNLDRANTRLSQAINLADLPLFEQARVLVAEQSIQNTLNLPQGSVSQDNLKSLLQTAISLGSSSANQAVALDPNDPANYIALGDLYQMLVPLKIDGVVEDALDAYNHAIALAPNYPKPYLDLAELYFNTNDNVNATTYANKAIAEKSNYTDAYFLLSQIETASGDGAAAVKQLQDATLIDPSNPDTYFELGLLYYQNADYSDAASSFKTTVGINSQYLNAWYYLALADQKLGNSAEASTILNTLHQEFPDNADISNALSGGSQAPAAPAAVATVVKGEKAKKLPVPTDTTTSKSQTP